MASNTQEQNNTTAIDEIDIKELVLRLLNKWYVFVMAGVVCVAMAVLYLLRTPSEFTTEGTLLIRSETKGLGGSMAGAAGLSMAADMFNISKAVDDELVILKSNALMSNMVEELSLRTQVFYRKRLGGAHELYNNEPMVVIYPEGYLDKMKGVLTIEVKKSKRGEWRMEFEHRFARKETKHKVKVTDLTQSVETPWGDFRFIENAQHIDQDYPNYSLVFSVATQKARVEQYRQLITSRLPDKKANAISVSITGNNIEKNEAIVNKIIELYNRDAMVDKNKASIAMTNFIDERIDRLNRELTVIESEVEEFRTQNNLADLSAQSRMAIEALNEYDQLSTEIDMQYSLMTFIEDFIKSSDSYDLIPSNTGVNDEALSNLIIEYNSQVVEYLRMTRSTNDSNPVVSQQKDRITLTRNNILQTITNVKDGIKIRKQDIALKSREIESQINTVPKVEREFMEISREQLVKRELYLFLLQKREETQLSLSSAALSSKIVDPAYTMLEPVAPRKMLILIMAVFLAGIIGVAYVYIYYLVHTTIDDKKTLRSLTDVGIISTLPQVKDNHRHVVMNDNEQSVISEMFRVLRSNIKFCFTNPSDKVIMMTSSQGGEGKSFIAINLALSFAILKKKVVIVGLDIRKPMLSQYLGVRPTPGVTNYLIDQDYTPEDIVQNYTENPNLDVIVAGAIPPNPSELLDSPRMGELFEYLRSNYDYVIMDTAPVCSGVSDTLQLAHFADTTLYVCRAREAKREQIEQLNEMVKSKRLHNVYLIYNGVPMSKFNGYGYGYGQNTDKK